MPHAAAAGMVTQERDAGRYQRHRPEQTLLYRIVDEYYPAFVAHLAEQGRELPGYVQREFEDYLKCGRLEQRIGSTNRLFNGGQPLLSVSAPRSASLIARECG